MKNREPFKLRTFSVCHNGFLSLISVFPYLYIMKNVVNALVKTHSIHYILCSYGMHDNSELQMVYYFDYFLKMYELIDTYVLALRKKPIELLHFFHHAATVLLTYYEQYYMATVQWGPIVFNLFIHIIMYYYYMLTSIGVRNIWWKQNLTTLQISQFVVDLVVCFIAWGYGYTAKGCNGTEEAALIGVGLIGAYLLLFLRFFYKTYMNKRRKRE